MAQGFASTSDMTEKKISFGEIGRDLYAFTAEGDPNSGIIVGDDGVIVIDAQATPVMAGLVIERVRQVTDKPIKYVVLSHYHAVRVLGASAYRPQEIIASQATLEMIRERGKEDMASEIGRFPRLFRDVESIPGLTWPTITFGREMTVWMGSLEVRISHVGAGHTRGDDVSDHRLVEAGAASTTMVLLDVLDELGFALEDGGRGSVAEALFVGVATDTGWFRYSNADERAFAMASRACA